MPCQEHRAPDLQAGRFCARCNGSCQSRSQITATRLITDVISSTTDPIAELWGTRLMVTMGILKFRKTLA